MMLNKTLTLVLVLFIFVAFVCGVMVRVFLIPSNTVRSLSNQQPISQPGLAGEPAPLKQTGEALPSPSQFPPSRANRASGFEDRGGPGMYGRRDRDLGLSPMPMPMSAPMPSPTPRTRETILETDRMLEDLEWGNIAFTAPGSIQLEETGKVQLLLGLAQSVDELKKALETQAIVEGAKIRVSDNMEAVLSGAGFDIIPITPSRQAISGKEPTEWKWDVKPRESGRLRLHLSLNVLLAGGPTGGTRALRTFDKEIEVTVTMRQRIGAFITSHVGSTVCAGLLVLAIGWTSGRLIERLVKRRQKRKAKNNPAGSGERPVSKSPTDSDQE